MYVLIKVTHVDLYDQYEVLRGADNWNALADSTGIIRWVRQYTTPQHWKADLEADYDLYIHEVAFTKVVYES